MEERGNKVFIAFFMYRWFTYVNSTSYGHSSFTYKVRIRKVSFVCYIEENSLHNRRKKEKNSIATTTIAQILHIKEHSTLAPTITS